VNTSRGFAARSAERLRLSGHGAHLFSGGYAAHSPQGQVRDTGLLVKSVALVSNRMCTVWVVLVFKAAGVGVLNPCIPLSPIAAPTSGLDPLASTVAINVLPS